MIDNEAAADFADCTSQHAADNLPIEESRMAVVMAAYPVQSAARPLLTAVDPSRTHPDSLS
jgi:hypothetical protein